MCGIAGAITKKPISRKRIDATISKMCNRGPDRQVFVHRKLRNGNHLYFLFSRLTILDLSNSSMQPIETNQGNLLIFNGEIYNYQSLRRCLESKSVVFKSTGDAEVLCHLIEKGGVDSLRELDGMFALAYFDSHRETLLLARDFFGEKPLLTQRTDAGLFFGSQNSFIFELTESRPDVNFDKCYEFLTIGYKSVFADNKTFFVDIDNIEAGSYQEIDANLRLVRRSAFRPRIPEVPTFGGSFELAVQRTRETLLRSVESRLMADVPITFCMSGGVDSSVLAAISKREFGLDFEVYTLASNDERYDEKPQVLQICDFLSIKPNFVSASRDDFLPRMQDLIRYHGAPVSTISYYIHSFLSEKIAQDGHRVTIMGTGADELFTGYYDHFNSFFASLVLQGKDKDLSIARKDWKKLIGGSLRNPTYADSLSYVHGVRSISHFNDGFDYPKYFLNQNLNKNTRGISPNYSLDILRNQMLKELFHESVPMILNQDDLNSMRFSIENRSPYLNYELFSLSSSFPNDYLIRNGLTKAPLRYAFRNLLPEEILFSPKKIGFNANIDEYLPLQPEILHSALVSKESEIWSIISRDKFLELLFSTNRTNSRNKFLFAVLSLKLFLDDFL
jgi:asparagine synthase (glutamine-hydrolysing)